MSVAELGSVKAHLVMYNGTHVAPYCISACDCRTNEGYHHYRAWNDTVWGCTVQLKELVRHHFGTARGYALLLLWLHGKTKTETAAR